MLDLTLLSASSRIASSGIREPANSLKPRQAQKDREDDGEMAEYWLRCL